MIQGLDTWPRSVDPNVADAAEIDPDLPVVLQRDLKDPADEGLDGRGVCDNHAGPLPYSRQLLPGSPDAVRQFLQRLTSVCARTTWVPEALGSALSQMLDDLAVSQALPASVVDFRPAFVSDVRSMFVLTRDRHGQAIGPAKTRAHYHRHSGRPEGLGHRSKVGDAPPCQRAVAVALITPAAVPVRLRVPDKPDGARRLLVRHRRISHLAAAPGIGQTLSSHGDTLR